MFERLRLWDDLLIGRDDQACAVHDGCAPEHRRQEGLVTWAIGETQMRNELPFRCRFRRRILQLERTELPRCAILPDFTVGVAEMDGNVALLLLRVALGLDASERTDQRGFAFTDMAKSADNVGRLPLEDFLLTNRKNRCGHPYVCKGDLCLGRSARHFWRI
jgi:hypothetical protein